jgi:nitrite reductase (NO-forming)
VTTPTRRPTRRSARAGPAPSRIGRGFWPVRDLPVLGWLLAAFVVAVLHPFLPAPRWLMLHLFFLGALTHAILVWSRHFAETLLHLPPGSREVQSRRLLLHNLGAATVITGVLTGAWPVTVAGATGVAAAVAWHGAGLAHGVRTALPGRFSGTVHYYLAAACFLPVGATLGVLLARDPAEPWHTHLLFAHVFLNLLGWVGLTVVGTLVTLWPTMLRTRITPGAEAAAAQALPLLVTSALVAAGAAAFGSRELAALGLLGYAAGLLVAVRLMADAGRRKRPASFATWSVLTAVAWLLGCLVALSVGIATASSWRQADDRLDWVVPFLAAGFGAQILIGALSYLVPVALGGGPTPVRAANAVLDSAATLRVVLTNAGLLVCLLPVPSAVRVLASALVLGSLAATLPLLLAAVRASRKAKTHPVAGRAPTDAPRPATAGPED